MLFFTKATFERKVSEALAANTAQLEVDLQALRAEHKSLVGEYSHTKLALENLKADFAEREVELTRDWAKLLDDHRRHNEAGVKGLLSSIKAVQEDVQHLRSLPAPPDPAPWIAALATAGEATSRLVRETDDTVAYLLESPREVIRESVPDAATSTLAAFQGWVRPMGR